MNSESTFTFFTERKMPLYFGLLSGFCIALVFGAVLSDSGLDKFAYVVLLFAICSSPLLSVVKPNDAFMILSVTMAMYFVEFGLLDAVSIFSPAKRQPSVGSLINAAEVLLMVGALAKIAGFHVGARIGRSGRGERALKDWPPTVVASAGLGLWVLGNTAGLYQDMVLQVENTSASVLSGYTYLGQWGSAVLILTAKYLGPLGIVMLAYWWTINPTRKSALSMIALIATQFVIGWVVDTKETALSAPVIILLTRFIVNGRVRWPLVLSMVIGIALVFPILTAKRMIMTEGMHLNRAEALEHTAEIVWRSIQERNSARNGKFGQSTQTLFERLNDKGAVELFVSHVGVDKPYKYGATLEPLLYAFIPRIAWSDKPGDNAAQTFNRDFQLSEDADTYMSPTHIGELYWNFGYPGAIVGMVILGALLGYTCARSDLSNGASMTRALIIIVTVHNVALRGGGQIELQYVLWLRTLALIWVLDRIIARPIAKTNLPETGMEPFSQPALIRFTNLMR